VAAGAALVRAACAEGVVEAAWFARDARVVGRAWAGLGQGVQGASRELDLHWLRGPRVARVWQESGQPGLCWQSGQPGLLWQSQYTIYRCLCLRYVTLPFGENLGGLLARDSPVHTACFLVVVTFSHSG
jgi:hypothetical protein